MLTKFNFVHASTIKWAYDRELDKADPRIQMLKLTEEVGELASSIAKNKPQDTIDAIGDILVVLTVLTLQMDLNLDDCWQHAYNQIKNRKGKMINGTFVKLEDIKE